MRGWMYAQSPKVTMAALGKLLDMTRSAVLKHLDADRMPVRYHEQLVAFGVPAQLLPEARDVRPGPDRKSRQSKQ